MISTNYTITKKSIIEAIVILLTALSIIITVTWVIFQLGIKLSDIGSMEQFFASVVTAITAWLVYRTTKNIAYAQQIFNLNSQWLSMNYNILTEEAVAGTIQKFSQTDVDTAKKKAFAFNVLTILESYHLSMERGVIDKNTVDIVADNALEVFVNDIEFIRGMLCQG